MSGFFDYWGKARPGEGAAAPYHLLAYHSLDVASVGEILLERDPVWLERLGAVSRCERAGLRKAVPLLLALHDLGKFSEPFQAQRIDIAEALQGRTGFASSRFRHDSLGHSLWRAWAKPRKAYPSEEGLAGRLISARAQGVDLLAADLDPSKRQIERAVLIAGDLDFLPAVTVAKDDGVVIEVVHSPDMKQIHRDLWDAADDRRTVDAAFVSAVRR